MRSRRKRHELKMWSNIESFARDENKNPLLLGWYSLNHALAHMIIPALDKMIEHGIGVPDKFAVQHDDIEDAAEEWRAVLEDIQDGFLAFLAMERLDYETDDEHEALYETHKQGMDLFAMWYPHLWD